MQVAAQKEVKPCWKCGASVTINDYGYGICRYKQNHADGEDAIVFGSRPRHEYKCAVYDTPGIHHHESYKDEKRAYAKRYHYEKIKPRLQSPCSS